MALDDDLLTDLVALTDYMPTISLAVDADDLAVLAFCVHQVRDAIDANVSSELAATAVGAINAMADVLTDVISEVVAAGRANAARRN